MEKPRFDLAAQVATLGADSLLPPHRLTGPQRRELKYAADNEFGLTSRLPINGLGSSAKRRMLERLCELGLFRPYVHGGYEITPAGRTALEET